ncbi:MAG: Flp pilus assembly protein CpaB [Dehalococcoidia bacterium]|jgi:pilus assembly protein CpaB|nr:Flp pilus assembly protein CpaB [Dehalococcoidia bacterium]
MLGSQAMSARGGKAALALAVALGLTSALLVYIVLRQAAGDRAGEGKVERVPVVVAAQAIEAGKRIAAEDVKTVMVPTEAVVPGVFPRVEDVVGKVARSSIAANEQITERKLVETNWEAKSRAAPLSVMIPVGKRAVAVEVEEATAVGGLVLPGDFVDVVGVFELKDPQGNKQFVSLLVAQNVQVLAVGQETPSEAAILPEDDQVGPGGGTPQPKAKTVTLALDPPQALAVSLADDMGKIHLALRPFSEKDKRAISPLPSNVPLPPELMAIISLAQ